MGFFKSLKGQFMKTYKKTVVVHTVELSEVDLDIAIENYPAVEKQVLDYIQTVGAYPHEGVAPEDLKDVRISMTVEFTIEGVVDFESRKPKAFKADIISDRPEISSDPDEYNPPPPPDTETKDVIMDPGTMMANLAKDFKPTNAEED